MIDAGKDKHATDRPRRRRHKQIAPAIGEIAMALGFGFAPLARLDQCEVLMRADQFRVEIERLFRVGAAEVEPFGAAVERTQRQVRGFVLGVEFEDDQPFALGGQGVVEFVVKAAELNVDGGELRVELGRAFERLPRRTRVAGAAQRESEREPAQRQLVVERQSAVGGRQRRLRLVHLQMRHRQPQVGCGQLVVAGNRGAVGRRGFAGAPGLGERRGERDVGLGIVVGDADRRLPRRDGVGGFARGEQRLRKRDPADARAGLEFEETTIGLGGGRRRSSSGADRSERQPGLRVARRGGKHLAEKRLGLVEIVSLETQQAEQVERRRLPRAQRGGLANHALGAHAVAGPMAFEADFQARPGGRGHFGKGHRIRIDLWFT